MPAFMPPRSAGGTGSSTSPPPPRRPQPAARAKARSCFEGARLQPRRFAPTCIRASAPKGSSGQIRYRESGSLFCRMRPRATPHLCPNISTRVKQCARDAGFDLCGIAPVRDFAELHVFPAWIADEKHGEMKYMEARDEAGELKRASLARVAPWARSVIVCAINYNTAHPYSTQVRPEEAGRGWISRYAWAREDYHEAVMRRLRQVENELRGLPDTTGNWPLGTGNLQFRSYVDTGPLIERVYAKYAGIGLIGKNTCIIRQQRGSWVF